jgi:hypothetical protein
MERSGYFTFFVAAILSNLRSRARIPLAALLITSLILNGIITNVQVKAQTQPPNITGNGSGTGTFKTCFVGNLQFPSTLSFDRSSFTLVANSGDYGYSGTITGGGFTSGGSFSLTYKFAELTCNPPGGGGVSDQTATITGTCGTNQQIVLESSGIAAFTGTGGASCVPPPGTVCPNQGTSESVTFNKLIGPSDPLKPWSVNYGSMVVHYTSNSTSAGALCTLSSDKGTLPISVTLYIPNNLAVALNYPVGTSTTSATVDYYQADTGVMNIQSCQFGISGIVGVNNNCFITSHPSSSNDIVVNWNSPGYQVNTILGSSNSGPRSYWVNLRSIGIDPTQPYSSADLNKLINYIHETLINDLTGVTRWGLFQDPPNDILVTNPNGQSAGKASNGTIFSQIPGSAYLQSGNRTGVLVLNPINGNYVVEVTGKTTGPFTLSSSTLNNNFTNPVFHRLVINDSINRGASKRYDVTFSDGGIIQPPTQTTITSTTDGNGNPVQNGGSTVSTSITFQVSATAGTDPISGFQCSLDGGAFSTCAPIIPYTVSYNNLAAGRHALAVRAVDTQGNTDPDPATFSWTVLTPTQATHSTTSPQLHVGTNAQQKHECKTTGGTSAISGSCSAAFTDWISQSGGIHHSASLRNAPSTLSLF